MADIEERIGDLEIEALGKAEEVAHEAEKVEEVADDGLEHVREEMRRLWPLGF